jgi:hypothetical protein
MDPGDAHDRGASSSERVYRALLCAYPQEVRRRYAEEMVRYFGDLCREESLEPSEKHSFRLEVPLYESAVVPLGEKQLPGDPFPGDPFVFDFEIPVHAVSVVEVNQKETAEGVTLTLERVINSPGRPRAVICYGPPDDEHSWTLYGGEGTLESGWSNSGWTGSVKGPVEGRSSVEVTGIEGIVDCPSGSAEAAKACWNAETKRIQGPWRFEFDVPGR